MVELVDKELRHALVHKLVDALLQLLRLHWVGVLNVLEELGREGRQASEVQQLARGKRVAYLERAVIGQAHYVSSPRLLDGLFPLRHELHRTAEAQRLALPDVKVRHVPLKPARAHLAESHAAAVIGVDVGGNLEDEAREAWLVRLDKPFLCLHGAWEGGDANEAVEQLLHAEVVQRRAEEHRGNLRVEVSLNVEVRVNAIYQLQVLSQFPRVFVTDLPVQLISAYVNLNPLRHLLLVGREKVKSFFVYVIDTLEASTLVDGPAQGAHAYAQLFLQLVEQVERVSPLAVHLVDEHYHGCLAHAAHGHQLACLRLYALRPVYHDDGGVDSR